MCVGVCVFVEVCAHSSSPIRELDDWICQPAGTLITSPIFRLTSRNHSHLRDRNELSIQEARIQTEAPIQIRLGGRKEIKEGEQYRWSPELVRVRKEVHLKNELLTGDNGEK